MTIKKEIEKISEELDIVCDAIGWEVDDIQEEDLGPEILLEANVRYHISKDDYENDEDD
jgi:hypothetical protein